MKFNGIMLPSAMLAFMEAMTDESIGKLIRASIERKRAGTPFPKAEDKLLRCAMLFMENIIKRGEGEQISMRELEKEQPPNFRRIRAPMPNERRHLTCQPCTAY